MRKKQSIAIFACILALGTQAFAGTNHRKIKRACISPAAASKYFARSDSVRSASVAPSNIEKIGNLLVLQADPELLTQSNRFDLQGLTIRFHPISKRRFAYSLDVSNFDGQVSQTLELSDDDSRELIFTNFRFPFGKKAYDRCYVNSNGSITFQVPDSEPPAAEGVSGNLARIAGFFTDLNPENSGAIFVHQTSDRVLISWNKVPEFYNENQFDFGQNTFQIVLYKSGVIDLVYTKEFTASQGFVGLIPGFDSVPLRFVDFSTGKKSGRQLFSFVENFHDYASIDIPQLMKSLYGSQPDRFDFVSLFSNFDLTPVPGAQAFAINVRNNVRGIGNPSDKKPIFKDNAKYGSKGKLQNITFFGNIHQYPADPSERLPDEDLSLLDIIAHEVAHRWLAYVKLLKNGNESDVILGQNKSHWSFFLNSEGSFLEGNQINKRSEDSFETSRPYQKYSDLDLYLMGLKPADEVKNTFYVENADQFSPDFPFSAESVPESSVRFKGNATGFTIQDIIAANGARKPSVGGSQKNFSHLFVLIVKKDQPATDAELGYLELVRSYWTDFFFNATGGKATIDTVLQ
jgi:hypothetical protein